jgi:hypothetical protein
LPSYDDQSITLSAREKAESFASINSKLGVVQKGVLTEAIRTAYAKRARTDMPFPDFRDVLDIAIQMYEEENKKDDSLIEVLRDLSDFELFGNMEVMSLLSKSCQIVTSLTTRPVIRIGR